MTTRVAELDDTVPADRDATVRDLLTMTPGFGWIDEGCPLSAAYERLVGRAGGPDTIGYDDLAAGRAVALGIQVGAGSPATIVAFEDLWGLLR